MSKQILVVEDNELINRMFCKRLISRGYVCESALSMNEGVSVLDRHFRPDLIVLDLELGDGYGTQVLDHVRQLNLHPIVIVVSANIHIVSLDGYAVHMKLNKPVTGRELLHTVDNLFAG